ncbi:hypothetical protein DPEC_G00162240 [Dallia pectoralis]|uniref:Uncharacterized protein n=1 Tax=Dallia pectoralis TaxID=75939 RepID=A0ACC2GH14_DALPE|nr:hypothetical protein DPEC_G00162240 [Dallia pectoralis]
MARPTRAKNQLTYSKLMELDNYEESAAIKGPPMKKSLSIVKDPQKDSLCEVRVDPMSMLPIREQRWAAAIDQQSSVLNVGGISQADRPGEDQDYQPTCTPATSMPVSSKRMRPVTSLFPRPSPLSPAGGSPLKRRPPALEQSERSPMSSQGSTTKSPGSGLRLGLSRFAKVKPLHTANAAWTKGLACCPK